MDLSKLKWDDQGLVTVVVQDWLSGEIRMVAHANREALEQTRQTGKAHFYSRSRKSQWRKGEASGNEIDVDEIWADCDGDAVIYVSHPTGPSCHTGRATCFFRKLDSEEANGHAEPMLSALVSELAARASQDAKTSYTRSLLDAGVGRIGEKVREEADEFAVALADESDERVRSEAADVFYHLLVGLLARGLTIRDVFSELDRRRGKSGHEEKAGRSKG